MKSVLFVGIGGFLGASSRYLITLFINRAIPSAFPIGTLLVNVLGCIIIGILLGGLLKSMNVNPYVKDFLTIGILGGLTTFSTFGYDTFQLFLMNKYIIATLNILLNVSLSILGVWIGKMLFEKFFS